MHVISSLLPGPPYPIALSWLAKQTNLIKELHDFFSSYNYFFSNWEAAGQTMLVAISRDVCLNNFLSNKTPYLHYCLWLPVTGIHQVLSWNILCFSNFILQVRCTRNLTGVKAHRGQNIPVSGKPPLKIFARMSMYGLVVVKNTTVFRELNLTVVCHSVTQHI